MNECSRYRGNGSKCTSIIVVIMVVVLYFLLLACNVPSKLKRVVYPGQRVTFPVRAVGEHQGSVFGTVLASTTGNAAINDSEKVQEVCIAGRDITIHTAFIHLKLTVYQNLI